MEVEMSAAIHITINRHEKWIADVTLDNVEHCKHENEEMKLSKVVMDMSGVYITYTCPYCNAVKTVAYIKVGEKYLF